MKYNQGFHLSDVEENVVVFILLHRCQSVTVYSFVKWCRLPRIFQNRPVVYRRIVIGLINMLVCWTRVFPEIRPVTACVTAATFLTGRVDHSSLMSGYRESGMWMCYRKVKFEKVRVSSTTLHSPHNLLSTSSTSLGSNSRHSANPLHRLTPSLPIFSCYPRALSLP